MMTLVKYFFSLLIFFVVMQSCTKIEIPEDHDLCLGCAVDTLFKNIDTLWSVGMPGDHGVSYKGIFSEGDLVIFVGEGTTNTFVTAYQKETGVQVWDWEEDGALFTYADQKNGILVLQNFMRLMAFDVFSGNLIHDYKPANSEAGLFRGQILGDHFYQARRLEGDSLHLLVRTAITDFKNWETIYTLKKGEDTGGSQFRIMSYNLWVDPETNDSILIMQHQLYSPNRVEIVALSLGTREIIWRHDDISPVNNSSDHQIMVHDNRAFFSAASRFYCFDMRSGDILWQFDHPSGAYPMIHFNPTYAYKEDAIIIKDDYSGLLAIDANTGNLLWMHTERGSFTFSAGSPAYHNGVVYYISEWQLWAANASTGAGLLTLKGNHDISQSFRGDIAIDHDRGVIYTSTRRNIFAIKALEP